MIELTDGRLSRHEESCGNGGGSGEALLESAWDGEAGVGDFWVHGQGGLGT